MLPSSFFRSSWFVFHSLVIMAWSCLLIKSCLFVRCVHVSCRLIWVMGSMRSHQFIPIGSIFLLYPTRLFDEFLLGSSYQIQLIYNIAHYSINKYLMRCFFCKHSIQVCYLTHDHVLRSYLKFAALELLPFSHVIHSHCEIDYRFLYSKIL